MALTKKRKKILLIVLPAAVAVIAAAVVLWLVLGQGAPKVLEAQYNQTTGELMHYTILEGASKEEEDRPLPLPMATFTPTEDWVQTVNAAEYADRFSTGYQDIYQSKENDYTTLTFSQQYAVEDGTVDPGQEVQFGDLQVIYRQEEESSSDLYTSEVSWVEGETLFTLTCRFGPQMEMNQMLELVSRVDTQTPRQPIHSPLTLERGSRTALQIGENITSEVTTYTCSEGNPEIPEDAGFACFSQPPEGYQLSEGYGERDNAENADTRSWRYSRPENNQDVIYLYCTLGSNARFRDGSQWMGFPGHMAYETDPSAIQDAAVNGNPAFVYLEDGNSEIAWVDGYCTLFLSTTVPMTAEQLIALAETVE